jgi:molecular chaperone IbpA
MNTRRLDTSMLNDPFFIGFDRMIDRMRQETPSQANYPPYNIIKTSDETYELQLAIAGFTYDDFDIELRDGTLTIDGNQSPKEDEPDYLHRGISARNFRRTFTLSDTIVVNGATLDSGILTISLENVIPEEKKPRKIEISNAASAVEQLNG